MVAPALPVRSFALGLRQRVLTLWQLAHLAALVLLLALSPSTYRTPWRRPLVAEVARSAWPLLPGFTLLSAIITLVIVRIVLVTALSYGLSQFALEMVVRVLVLELIPLTAAFAVALRVTVPMAAELTALPAAADRLHGLRAQVAPRALAGIFCVLLLAAVSSAVALVLAYLMAHGLSPWALDGYTRMVGQVFSPAVALVFVLKTGALALAVSVLPIGSALQDHDDKAGPAQRELRGLVRMFVVILAIEVLGLVGNYL